MKAKKKAKSTRSRVQGSGRSSFSASAESDASGEEDHVTLLAKAQVIDPERLTSAEKDIINEEVTREELEALISVHAKLTASSKFNPFACF